MNTTVYIVLYDETLNSVEKKQMHIMNFACQPLLNYCSVAMLVIVNGQSTTDDEICRDEISDLRDRIAILERQLRDNCQTTDASKLKTLRFEQHALPLLRTF